MVSIIIPIYNSEQYLAECLKSVKEQSYCNFEVLCVDDGSTDNSRRIIDYYVCTDDRFKLITKSHTNAGDARNIGLKNAKGDYLLFLDSDDFFDMFMLEHIVNCAIREDSDITVFSYKLYYADKNTISKTKYGIHSNRRKTFNLKDLKSKKLEFTNIAVWNKLYKKKYINNLNIEFKSQEALNDVFFSWISLICAGKISFCRHVGTYYRVNTGRSISDKIKIVGESFVPTFIEVNEYIKSLNLWDEYKEDVLYSERRQIKEFIKKVERINKDGSIFINEKYY